MRARAAFVLVALANLHGDCGAGCPTPPTPVPMTEARARKIDASVSTGIALSTTYVYGDCRPSASQGGVDTASCEVVTMPACARERRPMRVFVLDVNQSVPVGDGCDGGYAVAELSERAALEVTSSDELGEVVATLDAGFYSVFVTADDVCAVCGIVTIEGTCEVEIAPGRVTARDLVVDVSTR
ncbi:MAG: hypothetical protein RIT81_34305 [Deltaproteobacteria bacterium]